MTRFPLDPHLVEVLDSFPAPARPMITGGAVRDWLLGVEPKDVDVEVFNCTLNQLLAILKPFGRVNQVGQSFGVVMVGMGR